MDPTIQALIDAARAAPKTHVVLTAYTDGTVKRHETRSLATANTHADFVERPKIGRTLVDRTTGHNVQVVSVEVAAL